MPLPPLEPVEFGGLENRQTSMLVEFNQAITCDDCILDADQIEGRNGYRAVTAATISVGTTPQLIDRFRPTPTSAKTVAVTGGKVYVVADPTTTTASDGSASLVATPFGASAGISGSQLNDNYYMCSDEGVAMQRLHSDYTIETLGAIPQGAQPTAAQVGAFTWSTFSGMTQTPSGCISQTNGNTGWGGMNSAWRGFSLTNNGNDDPATGAFIQYKFAAPFDARGCNWLLVGVTPHDQGGTGIPPNYKLSVSIAVDVAGSPGNYTQVGQIYDLPPGAGSPNITYCNLINLDSSLLSAVQYIKIQCDGVSGGRFATYGYMFLSAPPLAPSQTYYVDFFNPTTGQESTLTQALVVNISSANITVASFPNTYIGNSTAKSTGLTDNPLTNTNDNWNYEAGQPYPQAFDIGAKITITGTTSAFGATPLVVRLWKLTQTGIRLVTPIPDSTGTYPGGSTVAQSTGYTLIDPGGLGVLSNQLYQPGGVLLKGNAMCAFAGRLVVGYQNRVYVSSFTPTSATTNPFPQFPDIPVQLADGWSFDLASKAEQIQVIVNGDTVYILTNYGLRVLTDLDAPLFGAPSIFHVYDRGCVGRQAAIFAEDRLFWVSYDGVYTAKGRTTPVELSVAIRDFINTDFLPGNTTTIGYQNRALYVFNGTTTLRYDFVKDRWSVMNLADSVVATVWWSEVPGAAATVGENLWTLLSTNSIGRFQTTVQRDLQVGTDTTTGAGIPDWSYSTGFAVTPQATRIMRVYTDLDPTGDPGRMFISKGLLTKDERRMPLDIGANVAEGPPDLKSYTFRIRLEGTNNTAVRRIMWAREAVDVPSP